MDRNPRLTKYIDMKTAIPGPQAQLLLERRMANIPRGPFHTVPTFAAKGEGALFTDVDGNTFIDFAGAIGSLNVGHCPPKVVEALKSQLDQYLHPCFHVMMYEPYVALAEKLNALTPGDHKKKTFFLNSGAEAVENAVKIARKYTGRRAVISFERGFHGRTYMAMSLTSKVKPYKNGFGPFAPDTYKMPYPYYYRAPLGMLPDEVDDQILQKFEDFFLSEVPGDEVAAIIMEPVQGEGGFVIPSLRFIQGVKVLCEKYGILLIADEVQTGFGRTGKNFAMEHYGVVPDLMTMSKSIAAGLPISAVTGRAEIMDAPDIGEIGGTYGGSPLGCVAALKVIEMLEEDRLAERAVSIGAAVSERFLRLQQEVGCIGDVRTLGAMSAIELVKDPVTKIPDKELTTQILKEAHQHGVIVMGAGLYSNVIRILSPLVITDEQLAEGLDVLEQAVKACISKNIPS
ncbi:MULTISPECIES: 4-aminobutyrate--2-oxoglutarate transaminase [unclassified Paenibacillus]|uniref:4-aminobutyrate--2-oxoglutarate transaminase n=1 Tax=unclassified Paenibacillus TaxID=185978 RepID=UPI00278B2D68|nr:MULTISPECIES: 4-aminobutyrate--2-oxoglutarate transaminase [unclassified Paenibacillus]MDQ0899556.1 4-aminobutyrate aminotransferase/(S)-3-amino-2-methylpropionate transaminase [Paenibacillus sp. V4I7]MDQ0914493.1 4-aminobutyrate aminotransferase/(S)-3-amino-2-methylpropionate transaminase [Paenibacillus sp. V4I5]